MQNYATQEGRINKYKGEMLAYAMPVEVLCKTGTNHKMPKNVSENIIFRRVIPTGGASTNSTTQNRWSVDPATHLTQEGVTGPAESVSFVDIPVQMQQYSCLYGYTDKVADMYEDDIPEIEKKLTGQRMGLVREMIAYGALKGSTNKFYAGGTSRATVDEKITLGLLRKIARALDGNRATKITSIISSSPNYGTAPVEQCYLVYVHTDGANDIRELPGFVKAVEYGGSTKPMDREIGAVDEFRFITSPELSSYANAGATSAGTGLYATTANVDVYPFIIVAEDAWGNVALRGKESFDVTHLPAKLKTKDDPHGQRGYVGAIFYSAMFVQND